MATRLYATSRSTGTILTGPLQGAWVAGDSDRDNRGRHYYTFLLAPSKALGGVVGANTAGTSVTKAANQRIVLANLSGGVRWVSPVLASDVTLAGTFTITLKVSRPAGTGGSSVYAVHVYSTLGDTLDLDETLLANATGATGWTGSPTWRSETFAITGTVHAGGRIVVEVGAYTSPDTTPPSDNAFTVSWGTTNSSQVAQADAVNGDTALRAAWMEFSDALAFVADPAPPPNDACVDAEVIAATPFTSAPLDTTQSTDVDRSVWYKWVSTVTGTVYATCCGGNYRTFLRAWHGSCGSLVIARDLSNNAASLVRTPWNGVAQAQVCFEAVAGTTYYFQISSTAVTTGPDTLFSALSSGGALVFSLYTLQPLVTDDLIVDCRQIVRYQNKIPACILGDFYIYTPTGNAVDYTRRPLTNLNGGTDTSERLYVCLFGSAGDVEILDLLTLNAGELEIDYLINPLQGPGRGQNLSTVVFDPLGNIILGWYGDAYSVIDRLSSPDACAIRRIDGTHADNQPAAPWPLAEKFLVAQENGGTDFVEMASDGETVYYTSGGVTIFKYHLPTLTQLAPFATIPPSTGPRPGARSVRLLPPGDGSGGCLVANGNIVYRLNAAGAVIQSYTPAEADLAQDLDKLEITHDLTEFWVSDQFSTTLFKFNIATGAQTDTLETNLPAGQLCGFSIYNGYRAGVTPPTTLPPVPTKAFGVGTIVNGQTTTLTITIHNPNASTVTGVSLTDNLPAGLIIATPNGLVGGCGSGTITAPPNGTVIQVSGVTLAPGATCTFTLNVVAVGTGLQTNSTGPITTNETVPSPPATTTITITTPPPAEGCPPDFPPDIPTPTGCTPNISAFDAL